MTISGDPAGKLWRAWTKHRKIWYAAARIPLSAVSSKPVQEGTKWRMNLYRIEGLGPRHSEAFSVLAADLCSKSRPEPRS